MRGARGAPGRKVASRNPAVTGAKSLLALFSILVLVGTGYYWAELENWADGMTTADVIEDDIERPPDGAIDVLLVGMDSRTDAQGKPLPERIRKQLHAGNVDGVLNTDTIILLRIPNDGGEAFGVSFPRDSFVEIPGHGKHKINSAYSRAKNAALSELNGNKGLSQAEREVRSNEQGAKSLIRTVEQLTEVSVDHYAEVNLLGFAEITEAIGGIEVCLKAPVYDRKSGADFPKGRQTLSGAKALAFVRQRYGLPRGDLDRVVRQQVFLSGMAKKVLSQDMLSPGSETLDQLRQAVQKSVVLDEGWNIIEFAQQMMSFTGGKVEFTTIPVGNIGMATPEDGSAVEVDPREVRDFMRDLINGGPTPSDKEANQEITVNVRNTTDRTNLAATVSETLAEDGFTAGLTGNAPAREATVVRYAPGEQANGQRVADALGTDVLVEEGPKLAEGHVLVLLGSDFPADFPAEHRLAGDQLLRLSPSASSGLAGQPSGPDKNGCVN